MAGDITYLNGQSATSGKKCFSISKSDTADFAHVIRGIYVGGTGDITIVNVDGTTAQFKAVPVGTVLPVEARRVNSTGTDATLMIGMY